MAKRINEDAIHVLVDMKQHTESHALNVIALKPAPVQVSEAMHTFGSIASPLPRRVASSIDPCCVSMHRGRTNTGCKMGKRKHHTHGHHRLSISLFAVLTRADPRLDSSYHGASLTRRDHSNLARTHPR
eukprot:730835-Rhodomonas_salina.2